MIFRKSGTSVSGADRAYVSTVSWSLEHPYSGGGRVVVSGARVYHDTVSWGAKVEVWLTPRLDSTSVLRGPHHCALGFIGWAFNPTLSVTVSQTVAMRAPADLCARQSVAALLRTPLVRNFCVLRFAHEPPHFAVNFFKEKWRKKIST